MDAFATEEISRTVFLLITSLHSKCRKASTLALRDFQKWQTQNKKTKLNKMKLPVKNKFKPESVNSLETQQQGESTVQFFPNVFIGSQ